jgi:hypothetical protein
MRERPMDRPSRRFEEDAARRELASVLAHVPRGFEGA